MALLRAPTPLPTLPHVPSELPEPLYIDCGVAHCSMAKRPQVAFPLMPVNPFWLHTRRGVALHTSRGGCPEWKHQDEMVCLWNSL